MNRKGFIIVAAVVFLIVAAITSAGLYNAVYFVSKIQGIDEVRRIRGYYAASSGLNYANTILRMPSVPPSPISLRARYPWIHQSLFGLNVRSEDVEITIAPVSKPAPVTGKNQLVGYDVTSTYTFAFSGDRISVSGYFPKLGIPKTGQTTPYPARDGINYNDDTFYQAGNPADPRFVDNKDRTITDNSTGLMWAEDAGPQLNWANAISYCESLEFAGHDDWRLPNIQELFSITRFNIPNGILVEISLGKFLPASIDPLFQIDPALGACRDYWSSTTRVKDTTYAWYVEFSGASEWFGKKSVQNRVRPVRGGW